jgi:predicted dehydrogenase
MKALVIGCGSIGTRHIHNLIRLGIKKIAIFDEDRLKIDKISKKYKTKKFYDLNSALSFEPDFSLICTYPTSHLRLANECIKNHSHVFIEKPISFSLLGVEKMLKKARSQSLQVGVGYNMRFDKGLNLIKNKLLKKEISTPLMIFSEWGYNVKFWNPGFDPKNHYVLKKGGGIILDDSHEYDYIRWLLEDKVKSVFCQSRRVSTVKTKTESIAALVLKFSKGTIASLLIDCVRPQYERKCHVIGEKGDLKWEFLVAKARYNNYQTGVNSRVTTFKLGSKKSQSKNFISRINDMYVNEMKNFIDSIKKNTKPMVDGWTGLETLKIGTAALESAKNNRIIRI